MRVRIAKAHAISAQIWSDYQQGVFDRSLMAYQPLIGGKQVALLEALRVRAETKRQAAAIHAHKLLERYGKPIRNELQSMNPWWLISFHYRDHHSKEDELLQDVAELKRKLHRIIYKSRDKSIKGAGEYPYPRMLFFHEKVTRARVSFTPI